MKYGFRVFCFVRFLIEAATCCTGLPIEKLGWSAGDGDDRGIYCRCLRVPHITFSPIHVTEMELLDQGTTCTFPRNYLYITPYPICVVHRSFRRHRGHGSSGSLIISELLRLQSRFGDKTLVLSPPKEAVVLKGLSLHIFLEVSFRDLLRVLLIPLMNYR